MTPAAIASALPPRFEDSSSEAKASKDPKNVKDGKKPRKGKSKKDDDDCEHEKMKDEESEDGSDPDHTFEGRGHDDDDDDSPDGFNSGSRKKKPATKGSQDSSSRKKPAAAMKRPASRKKGRKDCKDPAQACPEPTSEIGGSFRLTVLLHSCLGSVHATFHHFYLELMLTISGGSIQPLDCCRSLLKDKTVSPFSISSRTRTQCLTLPTPTSCSSS